MDTWLHPSPPIKTQNVKTGAHNRQSRNSPNLPPSLFSWSVPWFCGSGIFFVFYVNQRLIMSKVRERKGELFFSSPPPPPPLPHGSIARSLATRNGCGRERRVFLPEIFFSCANFLESRVHSPHALGDTSETQHGDYKHRKTLSFPYRYSTTVEPKFWRDLQILNGKTGTL